MEEQLNFEEWFFQSDYDLETAQHMLQTGRNIYCIFMCHLSLEKALKGLYIKYFFLNLQTEFYYGRTTIKIRRMVFPIGL